MASFRGILLMLWTFQLVMSKDVLVFIAKDKPKDLGLTLTKQPDLSQKQGLEKGDDYNPHNVAAEDQKLPIQINKFYTNLITTTSGSAPIYPMPYVQWWYKAKHRTWCIGYTARENIKFGLNAFKRDYFFADALLCTIGLSASEMTAKQTMQVSHMGVLSAQIAWTPSIEGAGSMNTTVSRGSPFVTMQYTGLQPIIYTANNTFVSLEQVKFAPALKKSMPKVSKFKITTNETEVWLVYVFDQRTSSTPSTPTTPFFQPFSATKTTSGDPVASSKAAQATEIVGQPKFEGVIQIARLPGPRIVPRPKSAKKKRTTTGQKVAWAEARASAEKVYDTYAGTFATEVSLSMDIDSDEAVTGKYGFDLHPTKLIGNELITLLFPHQQESLLKNKNTETDLKLWSITKGLMQAYTGDTLSFEETELPVKHGYLSPLDALEKLPDNVRNLIASAAKRELAQDIAKLTDTESLYFGQKALSKWALVCLVVKDVLKDKNSDCVKIISQNLDKFIQGKNKAKLAYDDTYKGVVQSCPTDNAKDYSTCGFGNAIYNDHHFQLAYAIENAAIVAHLDPSWLTVNNGFNKKFINLLIRDFANPVADDPYAPQFRSFDFGVGHSWARGASLAPDGKDQESSSEDINSHAAIKMWGQVTGDTAMVARANLMLAITRRAMGKYVLLIKDNSVQPPKYVKQNSLAGITWENKIAFENYFAPQDFESVIGIHQLPVSPVSAYVRTEAFVKEEFQTWAKFYEGVKNGWRGLFVSDASFIDPKTSYRFFASSSFDDKYLDSGASQTYSLALAAGYGGSGDDSSTSSSTKLSAGLYVT